MTTGEQTLSPICPPYLYNEPLIESSTAAAPVGIGHKLTYLEG